MGRIGAASLGLIVGSLVFSLCLDGAFASIGDRSPVFVKCLENCKKKVCENDQVFAAFNDLQPFYLKLTIWSCEDECKHVCMWKTVEDLQESSAPVPQFYGKWPFARLFGIQEPASAIFSLLNGLSFFIAWKRFASKVNANQPMYYVWFGYALISMNAWMWSTVFHSRDTNITEMLDYFSATAAVMYGLFCLVARVSGTEKVGRLLICAVLCTTLFIMHIYYLAFIHFDYKYNMMASVGTGMLNSIGWLLWCSARRKRQPYVWKCAATIVAVNILVLLELGDFPPILWTFDAHSLWHFGTIPMAFMWYSFASDDCLYLAETAGKSHEL